MFCLIQVSDFTSNSRFSLFHCTSIYIDLHGETYHACPKISFFIYIINSKVITLDLYIRVFWDLFSQYGIIASLDAHLGYYFILVLILA